MNLTNWRVAFMEAVGNPATRFTVSLDGLVGATTEEQVMTAAAQGAANPGRFNFAWELSQLYQAGRLSAVTFMRAGKTVPNPF